MKRYRMLTATQFRTKKERIEEWANHFERLLKRPPPAVTMITDDSSKPFSEVCIDPPTTWEVKEAIIKLKRKKDVGLDNIPPELYLDGGNGVTRNKTQLLQSIWASELMPSEWKTSVVIHLFKKGDKTNCTNYRGNPF